MLFNLADSLRLITMAISPAMPETAQKMLQALGLEKSKELVLSLEKGGRWGLFPEGCELLEAEPLFPRVEVKKEKNKPQQPKKAKKSDTKVVEDGLVTFDQFKKVELRIAEIISAERVEGSDRLLLLTVQAHEKRTIVAGIAEHYRPEDIVGLQVVLVANMKPAKIMGIRSEGMLLAARTEENGKERLVLTTVSAAVNNGSIVA